MWEILSDPRLWQYLSIPVVAALIGLVTNWLAIKMTFYPIEFIGKRPWLGWQGIIPSKARKMATISVDATLSRLGTVEEIFQEINPRLLAEYLVEALDPRLEEYVDEVMLIEHPTLWENMPAMARAMIVQRVRDSLPARVNAMVADISANIDELLDLQELVIDQLGKDKALLNRVFEECGDREFRFIIKSGLYFGFGFGLIQMAAWYFFQPWWILPLFGLMVGWGTNWLALNIIFRPLKPIKVGPFIIQGLFLKRQPEVAAAFCHIVTHEVLTVGNIVRAMLDGENGDWARSLIRKHIKPLVDETTLFPKPFTQVALGARGFADIKTQLGELAIDLAREIFDDPAFEQGRARAIEKVMRERMEKLPSPEFQDLLRPCFQEDENKLILIGAAMGYLAGLAQLVLVFGEQFWN
ncbi:DUF445 domain-containing protein [Hydrocarboniclastica marina]|uniref:DUF445 family protein n=1 Tax=Hydrocarboniclastica marina TaxID=2259620 RepID=A0A4P7XFX0_9ALTE|nr:hypothetical protein [Hydrocarboniclastica marina]MAL99548.1 hypothetical protein [Alteromonadaceae bacterium]QCF25042.1 hypothetical protein soil367_03300 [Hydrocarboniclastica marina]|tara:strand:+ start:133 stop:1365 length:1233 start_codon:yes stop_codon:yes gene_type:complete